METCRHGSLYPNCNRPISLSMELMNRPLILNSNMWRWFYTKQDKANAVVIILIELPQVPHLYTVYVGRSLVDISHSLVDSAAMGVGWSEVERSLNDDYDDLLIRLFGPWIGIT